MIPINDVPEEAIARATEAIAKASQIVVLTGAGISTDSGIPDFRGPNGVWTKDPKAEKSAHISTYVSDPEHRRRNWARLAEGSIWMDRKPNVGHRSLVDLEASGRLHTLVTQNVDGLHSAAGTSADVLVEIHGTTARVKCLDCGAQDTMESAIERVRAGEQDPPCEQCDGLLKSATISFGQSLVAEDLQRSQQAAETCDLLLCVGTSLAVFPIAHMATIAARNGTKLVIVNGEPTSYDVAAEHVFHTSISDILPRLVSAGEGLA